MSSQTIGPFARGAVAVAAAATFIALVLHHSGARPKPRTASIMANTDIVQDGAIPGGPAMKQWRLAAVRAKTSRMCAAPEANHTFQRGREGTRLRHRGR